MLIGGRGTREAGRGTTRTHEEGAQEKYRGSNLRFVPSSVYLHVWFSFLFLEWLD